MKRQLSDLELVRAQDLLVLRATDGLEPDLHAELVELGVEDIDSFDLAAAAIEVSTLPLVEEMPAELADLIVARGLELVSSKTFTAPAVPAVAAQLPERIASFASSASNELGQRRSRARTWIPWLVASTSLAAAASAIVYATTRSPASAGSPAADIREHRGDAKRFVLAPAGDVVWSGEQQAGRLHFVALPANDPSRERYQVWIVDRDRDPRFPVDGGMFDSSGATVEVPFTSRLPIGSATGFVVTLEGARGAVVSQREHVVAEMR